MEKQTVHMALLLDFYGELLTEKQREAMELYYNEDYSLAEIAKLSGITPQGVRDAIQRGEATLLLTEEKTGLMARVTEAREAVARARESLRVLEAQCDPGFAPLFAEVDRELEHIEGGGPHGV
ncbi:MAG: YlxM family DNA-binding protein [Oscillospiraceae bacterium]|nr:YlxM family DNA-binding protein [Oscillospiraceae bacterium]